jgi:HPt (histidine-containing phosphotransfer) domain-containing protein
MIAASAVAVAVAVATPASALLDSAGALRRMGGLMPVYLIALRSFGTEADDLGSQLRSAADTQDFTAARAALHVLKGLAGTIGADQLSQLSALAEQTIRQHGGNAGPEACRTGIATVLAALPPVVEEVAALLAGYAASR